MKKIATTGARGASGVISGIFKVIGTVLLIGILTAVIFACIFVIYLKTNLTSDLDITLEEFTINQTSTIYYNDSETGTPKELCTLLTPEYRSWLNYDEIPIDFEHATVAIEDKRFYDHNGVDWSRTASAFFHMFLSNSNTYGGSTLTQQLIKNVTTEDDVTVQRKLLEIFRALELEKNYDKKDIMEWYLNVVYFGHGRYGIAAASEYYFGKSVSELNVAEIASIVGITNNPSMYSPYLDAEMNKERQETILFEMEDQGYITEAEYKDAIAYQLSFVDHSHNNETDDSSSDVYSWFVEAIIDDVTDDLMEAKNCSREIAQKLLYNGGYKIYSTIDMDVQKCVDEVYEDLSNFETNNDKQLQSAIVITDPYTGNIVAMSGGVGEKTGNRVSNRATDAERPAGSSIKPLSVYGPAIEYGYITPDTKIDDSEYVTLEGTDWMPNNDSLSYKGVITIRQAVISSVNTVAAQVVDMLTPAVSYQFVTEQLHLTLEVSDCDYAPMALGQLTYGTTTREMAAAYNVFVNNGIYTESRTYTSIYDADDKLVYENIPETNTAISAKTAYWITSVLQDAVSYGTGYEAQLSNMPVAGKTGTTSDKCDRWFAGYTPYYVGVVWTGYDYPEKISWSGNPAAQVWEKIMSRVHESLEYKSFSTPDDTYLTPVYGVEEIPYIVRGVDEEGKVLYENSELSVDGNTVTVTAQEVEGYTLVGSNEVSLTINASTENIVEFVYKSNTPEEDPNDPNNPNNPNNPSTPDTPVTPDNPDNPNPDTPDVPDNPIQDIINWFN